MFIVDERPELKRFPVPDAGKGCSKGFLYIFRMVASAHPIGRRFCAEIQNLRNDEIFIIITVEFVAVE